MYGRLNWGKYSLLMSRQWPRKNLWYSNHCLLGYDAV